MVLVRAQSLWSSSHAHLCAAAGTDSTALPHLMLQRMVELHVRANESSGSRAELMAARRLGSVGTGRSVALPGRAAGAAGPWPPSTQPAVTPAHPCLARGREGGPPSQARGARAVHATGRTRSARLDSSPSQVRRMLQWLRWPTVRMGVTAMMAAWAEGRSCGKWPGRDLGPPTSPPTRWRIGSAGESGGGEGRRMNQPASRSALADCPSILVIVHHARPGDVGAPIATPSGDVSSMADSTKAQGRDDDGCSACARTHATAARSARRPLR